ncbi:hypothetical protein SAMN06295926_12251 [Lysinibacillus sp. AC-3]|nr:hypothetical protein SAMN06295926_12251 [Lysinibacillus sp. AC-3]
MFFVRKRSDSEAAATGFGLCESETATTTPCRSFSLKSSELLSDSVTSAGALGQHDVDHSVFATGRGVLSLSTKISAGVWTLAERS